MSAALVAVTVHVPDASVTERTVPETEQPVDEPAENVTVPVPLPPDEERVEVAPYVREEGVEMAVRVD